MRFLENRRGVSPLVATLLLIALSIALGAAVMSWGEDYISAKAEFVQGVQETVTSCDLVSFSVITISGVQQLCQDGTTVRGLIDNGPDADIADIHARVVGRNGIFVQESLLKKLLPRGSATPIVFSTGDLGMLEQIKLTPKILIGGKPVVCSKQAIAAENILPCQEPLAKARGVTGVGQLT